MLNWFRKGLSPYQTALAMVGAKSGDQVVIVGAGDADLSARIALVTGLNGQTTVIDADEARPRVEAAASRAGALVEFSAAPASALPVTAGSVDVVVFTLGLASLTPSARVLAMVEATRILRPGGRTVVIEGIATRGPAGAASPNLPSEDVLALLTQAGGRAVRTLATAGGRTYYEARKPRDADQS
jgi:ubiquinone/menaquinone biosynthesis C-methylase UbiE